jgi:fructuronate reductase
VHAAEDLDALRDYFARPEVGVVTLTVTEAGYRREAAGGLDLTDGDVRADVMALTADPRGGVVTTIPGKLVAGLLARRVAGAGPIAVIPNDNVPENGAMVARVVADLGAAVDPTLAPWVEGNVSFVTTMVDRITPRTTDEDCAVVVDLLGVRDPQVVPTEPFSEWVLAGDFPAGRPSWESSGATVVGDVRPFEQRKLWLLNGAHSLMAYAGSVLGHQTVAEAVTDPRVRSWVEQWWDTASRHLPLPNQEVTAYRQALLERFTNPNIRHLLAQIAADGSQKIPIRAVPVLTADAAYGQVDPGATRLVAAWIVHLRGYGAPVADGRGEEVVALASGELRAAVAKTLAWLGVDSTGAQTLIEGQVRELLDLADPVFVG